MCSLWTLAACVIAAATGPFAGAQGARGGDEEARIAELVRASGIPSASVAVVEHGELVYAKAFGKASLAPERAADASTRYFVGSVSKQFTAAAILLAAEEGKLSLDDRVSRFYPELTRAGDITVRELLSHSSGYEDFAPQDYLIPEWTRPTTPDAVIKVWAGRPLDFEPGTRWQYSNTNYVLAARIFERATGETLVPFLRRRIFEPLGMASATDGYLERRTQDALPYTRFGLGPPRSITPEAPNWYYGAAQLAMTPSDLARWDIALLNHRILSEASYRDLTGEVRLRNGDLTHYALGLGLGDMDGIPEISHTGEVTGFLTSNAIYPTRDAAVVVCTNQDSVFVFRTIARQVAKWLLEPERRVAEKAPAAELSQVQAIVEGLRRGRIDRALFTANASGYFSVGAIEDIRASLRPMGPVKAVERKWSAKRGGMTFRDYAVQMKKGSVDVTVYLTPQGLYEQFLIAQDI
jgi:CubicO group peptidase (beta-lactamase class C family)